MHESSSTQLTLFAAQLTVPGCWHACSTSCISHRETGLEAFSSLSLWPGSSSVHPAKWRLQGGWHLCSTSSDICLGSTQFVYSSDDLRDSPQTPTLSLCSKVTISPIELRCILCQELQIPPEGFATAIEFVLQAGQNDGQRHGQWDAGIVEDAALCRPGAWRLKGGRPGAAPCRLQLLWQEKGAEGLKDEAEVVKSI